MSRVKTCGPGGDPTTMGQKAQNLALLVSLQVIGMKEGSYPGVRQISLVRVWIRWEILGFVAIFVPLMTMYFASSLNMWIVSVPVSSCLFSITYSIKYQNVSI